MKIHIGFLAFVWLMNPALAEMPNPCHTSTERIDKAIAKGVDFLVSQQNMNGSWGGPHRTKDLNIYAPVPGAHRAFQIGANSLALCGLLDSEDRRPETLVSIRKAADRLASTLPRLRRPDATTTYNVWGHAYGLRALSRLHRKSNTQEEKDRWRLLAKQQIEISGRYQDINGGWGYLDLFDEIRTRRPSGIPTSFTTATMLLAMAEARDEFGIRLDGKLVNRCLASIRLQQNPDYSYAYSYGHRMRPRIDINRPAGSLSRSQACNACLREFGDPSIRDEILVDWADRMINRNGFLDNARKRPVPHEGSFRIAGYFFYYGIWYFTESVGHLKPDQQAAYAEKLADIVVPLQEKDGSWWDYPLYDYHQSYGTGYALMSLAWCRQAISHQSRIRRVH